MAENKKIKKCPVSLQPDIENLLQDLTPDDFASASSQEKEDFIQDRQSVSYWKGFFRNYPLLLLYPMYLNFASSNCLPHLPYIVRFIIFNLLLVPSTNPLL